MSLACHSLFSKSVIDAMNAWRDRLLDRSGIQKLADDADEIDEQTLAKNRRSAIEAAMNMGAARA